jgi:hypothetical protein
MMKILAARDKVPIFAPIKLIVSISLLLVFSFQSISSLCVLISFFSQQDYIAANLCEKRAEPKSCCKGKCHLGKKLKEAEQSQKKLPDLNKFKVTQLSSTQSEVFFPYPGHPEAIVLPAFMYGETTGMADDIFHPPWC